MKKRYAFLLWTVFQKHFICIQASPLVIYLIYLCKFDYLLSNRVDQWWRNYDNHGTTIIWGWRNRTSINHRRIWRKIFNFMTNLAIYKFKAFVSLPFGCHKTCTEGSRLCIFQYCNFPKKSINLPYANFCLMLWTILFH